jgi:spore maturation protein CgeB
MHRASVDQTYNRNSQGVGARSLNPRTFEINACGALQLTDVRSDLAEFYKPGEEIETYSSAKELVEKCEYYLNHEDKRQAIAMRGMIRTMNEHTYHHRLNEAFGILYDHKPSREA